MMLFIIFLLGFLPARGARGSACKTMKFSDRLTGKQLYNHPEANFTDVTEKECGLKCYMSDTCQSYNYQSASRTCQISSSTRFQHQKDLKNVSDDFVYAGAMSSCDIVSCPDGQKCKADFKTGNFSCIKEPIMSFATTMTTPLQSTPSAIMSSSSTPSSSLSSSSSSTAETQAVSATSTSTTTTTTTVSAKGCVLYFPSALTSNLIDIDNAITLWFSTFSISVWLKVDRTATVDTLMVFSYATSDRVDTLSFGIKSDGDAIITLGGKTQSLASGFTRDNTWQHILVNFGSNLEIYKDNLKRSELNIESVSIRNEGRFILGQLQKTIGGGFDETKTFHGYMGSLNIWDHAKDSYNIALIYNNRCQSSGSFASPPIISWDTITSKPLHGDIQPKCDMTCIYL
ncbi:uncharacterized protein LOC116602104 [Nematostella vectensis]|uniref:uncharacterized protein LOC116602104 n=1 Tax=Nematostella vectensis TaxID=45351 RepID=UPI0020778BCF|nr:uncharacterized protein LOC116602104 [Nematostella vectensis]